LAANHPVGSVNFDTLADWLTWQESLHVRDIELGLERCRLVAETLRLSRPANIVVTVAGTNGKGSSVAMLEAIWRAAGYTVGTYTSPHLLRYNERIRINGTEASDDDICAAFRRIENARGGTPLTYFEFGTLAALALFEGAALDIVILEVGLGGRLDAVNIVDADVALITAIGIDHVEYLGDTREAIALEKAGILRTGRPAVCSDIDMPDSLAKRAAELATPLDVLGETYRFSEEEDTWTWWCGDREMAGLPKPKLVGPYQLSNAAGVLRVVDLLDDRLPVDLTATRRGLIDVAIPGRFQRLPNPVETIVDVAHNPQAVEAFVQTLETLPAAHRTHVILGMLRVKDRDSVIRSLARVADQWHLASVVARRGASSAELLESFRRVLGKSAAAATYDSVSSAYRQVLAMATPGDRVVAVGSFLVVAEILECT